MKDSLRIAVKDIPEDGLELRVDQNEPRFGRAIGVAHDGPAGSELGTASFQLVAWPDRVDVHGVIETRLRQSCSRCAEPFLARVEREFLRVFLRSSQLGVEEDSELSSTDLDRDELVGAHLDLGILLEEELLLSLPAKPLCMNDCKGICAGCGADLNETECSCGPEPDHRWSALAGFKVDN
jgi:uncharacterized protein